MNKRRLALIVVLLLLAVSLGTPEQTAMSAQKLTIADNEMSAAMAAVHSRRILPSSKRILVEEKDILNKQDVTYKGTYHVFLIGGESAKKLRAENGGAGVLVFDADRVILILEDKEV